MTKNSSEGQCAFYQIKRNGHSLALYSEIEDTQEIVDILDYVKLADA